MELRLQRRPGNTDLPLPRYETAGAAGMDLRACLPDGPVTFARFDLQLIPTGFAVELPQGTELQVRPRSGLSLRQGFLIPNSPGTVDEDYRGEIMVGLLYLGAGTATIAHGDRIAQAVIAAVQRATPLEVTELTTTDRGDGGFGSTGRQ